MKQYVLGFVFTENLEDVVLVKKQRPEWQKGKLNGVGGKIETAETALEAMRRKFREETSLFIYDWQHILVLEGDSWQVEVFATKITNELYTELAHTTDEEVCLYGVDYLLEFSNGKYMRHMIGNIPWLVSMARCMLIPGMDNCSYYKVAERS